MKDVKKLIRASLLLALAIIAQALGRSFPQISQLFVGSIVNCILLISSLTCSTYLGVLVGALTPVLAWVIGQLPAPMGPFVPFIAIGNGIYIIFFALIYKREESFRKYLSFIVSSIFKYFFLFLSSTKLIYVLNISIPQKVANKLAIMMGFPQLITALIGGALALFLYEILIKRKAM
ncbi:ECF transporter S component [Clostridium cochlearium]|uniref:Membrane spanning protein n=1 Tax=Clostridium cochlearium TaxID=1494 RepID=A0A2X2W6N1_CLOCO|nr:ECF transporter S component [Clostridium cochlearium]MBU5268822.1 ECF transporter S component [Clostridium cochlearium]SQB33303.1 membrane spanning protein [Clostridium cochlearium]